MHLTSVNIVRIACYDELNSSPVSTRTKCDAYTYICIYIYICIYVRRSTCTFTTTCTEGYFYPCKMNVVSTFIYVFKMISIPNSCMMQVANKCSLPAEALAMIRYHSAYPWHTGGAYREFMTARDE